MAISSVVSQGQAKDWNILEKWKLPELCLSRLRLPGIIVFGTAVAAAMGFAFYGYLWTGIFFSPFTFIWAKSIFEGLKDKERQKQEEEFIDAITALSFALQAGYSVENSFFQAADELRRLHGNSLITKEFYKTAYRTGRNERVEDVLNAMGKKLGISDICEFACIFDCARKNGGNMVEIIRRTSEQMKEKHEINAEVRTLISGKKFEQKILCAMPLFIVLYLKISAGEFIEPMYGNILGVICMTFCAAAYMAAIYWAGRITDIKI